MLTLLWGPTWVVYQWMLCFFLMVSRNTDWNSPPMRTSLYIQSKSFPGSSLPCRDTIVTDGLANRLTNAWKERRTGRRTDTPFYRAVRSAVPLPCFFNVVKSRRVAGQRSWQGIKSCRMGRNSVRPFVCLSVRLFALSGWFSDPAGPQTLRSARGVWRSAKGVWGPAGGVWGSASRVWGLASRVWGLARGGDFSPHFIGLCSLSWGPLFKNCVCIHVEV